jgi:predicted nucleic acid-binding Zn ribbon protein
MVMRRKNAQVIGDVVKEMLKKQKLNKGLLENRAVHYWSSILGPTVARATKSIFIRNGVIYVQMESSVMRNELLMWKDKIISNINTAIGEDIIREIVIR